MDLFQPVLPHVDLSQLMFVCGPYIFIHENPVFLILGLLSLDSDVKELHMDLTNGISSQITVI